MEKLDSLSIKSDAPGAKLFMLGNEAIGRGAIEGGVQVMGAYPGTPSTEIAETLIDLAKDFDIYAEWSVNEKVAFGVAMGASICGVRAMSVMKHVGVNVALDLLMTSTYLGAKGGLVLVEAEDPGQWSSSDEQDNRFLAEEAYLPVLEPSSAQEAKDMTRDAFRLSEEFGQPFMIRSVTRIGHARGDVALGAITRMKRKGTFAKDSSQWVMLPAVARKHRKAMVERLANIKAAADSLSYNQLGLAPGANLGIIASGISYAYVMEALAWLGLEGKVSLLKIGTPYPMPENLTKKLLSSVPVVLVVEELEPYVENHVKVIAQESGVRVSIHGKDLLPVVGELSTRKVTEAVCKMTKSELPLNFNQTDKLIDEIAPILPSRPPSLCAGCPHRASHYAINLAVVQIRRDTGMEAVRPGDIGCYCLGANEPLSSVDTSTCMGSGFDLAGGMARVLDTPIVAHLGDSTFFHSGIGPLINAVFNKTRMTMVVLDNLTTAMTGSQPNPGVGSNACNSDAPQIRPEDVARAAGVKFVEVVDPYDLKNSTDTMIKAINFDGPSMVVFRRPCSILEQRDRRARGELTVPYQVDREKCLQLSPPACTSACPLHIDVRGYVGLAREGKYTESLKLIKEKLPFPAILGRICTHPCQTKCKRGDVDDPIAIMALKRAAADYGVSEERLVIAHEKKEKVAIAGSGPAGIMAAYDLRKLGYQVTLYEASPVLGGMLALGIPEYRLPRKVLDDELSLIDKMGIEIKLNTRVGKDVNLDDLRKNFRALFIAIGAHKGRSPGIKNVEVNGVMDGIEFLRKVNLGQKIEARNKVVVVGGGNVAIDCARTCIRMGFKDVHVMYRRSPEEMPAINEEANEAEKEGVKFTFLAVPTRVLSDDGKVSGAECIRMSLGERDAGGRRQVAPMVGSGFVVDTDMILLATGEQPDFSFLNQSSAILEVKDGFVVSDPLSLQTNVPEIFAGGDVVGGPGTVVDALAAGRRAADSIDRFLRGEPLCEGWKGSQIWESRLEVGTAGVASQPTVPVGKLAINDRVGNVREVEIGYSREQATSEATRCLVCGCKVCILELGCPAIITEGDEVIIDNSQCPGCGICAQVCPADAICKK